MEIERWAREGSIDIGFVRKHESMTTDFEFLERDELKVILPRGHCLCESDPVSIEDLCEEPFILLEKKENDEVSDIFRSHNLEPRVKFTTWDDYAIMSMVENGMGVSILPDLILRRIPYTIEIRSLNVPAYRDICAIMRDRNRMAPAASHFMSYLKYRNFGCKGLDVV